MVQRALSASVITVLLVFAPLGLEAQEREVRRPVQVSVLQWLAGVWNDVAGWLAPEWDVDGTCAVDPNGCPDAATAPASSPDSDNDGSCAVDPDGCP